VLLDGDEQFLRTIVGSSDQTDERPVAVEDRPQCGATRQARLTCSSRHGEGEQPTFTDGSLDPPNHAEMVVRPGTVERRDEVRLAEQPERFGALLPPGVILDLRYGMDVLAGLCGGAVALGLAALGLGIVHLRGAGLVQFADKPADVPYEMDVRPVPKPQRAGVHLPAQARARQHHAQRRRVDELEQFRLGQLGRVNRHSALSAVGLAMLRDAPS